MNFLFYIILQLTNLNPAVAANNVATAGLLGSLLILAIWFIIHLQRKSTKEREADKISTQEFFTKMLAEVNKERIFKDKEGNVAEQRFTDHLIKRDTEQMMVIQENTNIMKKIFEYLLFISNDNKKFNQE